MYLHASAKLGLAGRVELVRAIEAGLSLRAAAAAFPRALSSFVRYCNGRRPHSALDGRPPISRVHNVYGQDN